MTGYNSLPSALLAKLRAVQWLKPWRSVSPDEKALAHRLEEELRAELGKAHVIFPYQGTARAIAKRDDCDDVLFWLVEAEKPFAVVHLTWSGSPEADSLWPRVRLFKSLDDFVECDLIPTHRDWSTS